MKNKMKNINIKISSELFNTLNVYHNNDIVKVNQNIRLMLARELDDLNVNADFNQITLPFKTVSHVLQISEQDHKMIKLLAIKNDLNMNELVSRVLYYRVGI